MEWTGIDYVCLQSIPFHCLQTPRRYSRSFKSVHTCTYFSVVLSSGRYCVYSYMYVPMVYGFYMQVLYNS